MDTSKITQQIIMDALRQSGIKVVPVTDEEARDFFMDVERRNRAEYKLDRPDIFCSTAAMILQSLKQERATASQWLGMLAKAGGIKAGEDAWTGLSEWLRSAGEQSLSKSQIMDYISSHQLIVEEVQFGLPESSAGLKKYQREMDKYIAEAEDIFPDNDHEFHCMRAFECMEDYYGCDFSLAFGQDDGKLYVNDSSWAADFTGDMIIDDIRLQHTTKGLDDYKELAFYTDNTPSWEDVNPSWENDNKVHFGEVGDGRCIAWVRFGEKTVNRKPTAQEVHEMRKKWPGPEGWTKTCNSGVNVYHTGQWNFPHERAMITQTTKGYSLYNMITDRQSMHGTL